MTIFLLFLLLGVFIKYVLNLIFLIPVFWLHTAHGLREIYFSFDRFASRPHGIFRGFVARLLTSILPFALIASFPTQGLFDGFSFGLVTHMLVVALVLFAFMVWLWRRGLRAYASASS